MSYILDALRRSEQQRQLAAAPSLYTAQIAANADHQPALLLYGILATVLIGSGILIGWLRPWQHGNAVAAPEPIHAASTQPDTHPAAALPPLTPEPPNPRKFEPLPVVKEATSTTPPLVTPNGKRARQDAPPTRQESVAPRISQPAVANAAPSKEATPHGAHESMAPAAGNPPAPKAAASTEDRSNEPARKQEIIALDDLPPDIRQEIPQMAISGFSYSEEPRQRIVGINERLLQEGQYLAPGLKLERIGPDGLVFSYKDFHFRKSLQ